MPSVRALEPDPKSSTPQPAQNSAAEPDPKGQSPDEPIEFAADTDVARGNEERANAEPEPQALHAAEVPGKPDVAQRRREIEKDSEIGKDS
ncbi:MAG: hypothetical protein M4D80_28335 [Myxococcota bacterium]|nr:hypothetical protein [Myxococcota bacterium]